jgi:UTP--glucose-1-phosphate uridylyltransferase
MPLSAVITAAAPNQRHLLHQTLAKSDGQLETLARFALELVFPQDREPLVDRLAFIIPPGDTPRFEDLLQGNSHKITLIEQSGPRGYVQALYQAKDFVGSDPFLHLVGDHFYMANDGPTHTLAAQLIESYQRESSTIVAVQPTREALLQYFGAVGGVPWPSPGSQPLYQVQTVLEKPTPTEAEQKLVVSGLRSGHYLCFFGMHLFSPSLMAYLDECFAADRAPASLSAALDALAQRERVLATILPGSRFDLGARYGVLQAQLALALKGPDREEILTMMLELLAR